jgi:hypothetical protein
MAGSGVTRAQENKKIRAEALREQLRAKGLMQHVIETAEKLADLTIPLESNDIQRLKAANDARLALVKKYLPDLKQTDIEVSGPSGGSVNLDLVVEFVEPKNTSTD